MNIIETIFEKILWNSRFMVLIAVIASLIFALAVMFMATIGAWQMVSHLGDYLYATGEYKVNETPMELLYLTAGIALLGLAIYLSHAAESKH